LKGAARVEKKGLQGTLSVGGNLRPAINLQRTKGGLVSKGKVGRGSEKKHAIGRARVQVKKGGRPIRGLPGITKGPL